MLNLWRMVGERVRIETPTGEVIWLLVCDLQSHRVQIGVEADRAVRIDREERHLERMETGSGGIETRQRTGAGAPIRE